MRPVGVGSPDDEAEGGCAISFEPGGRSEQQQRADSGLMTLEWLLIVAAIASLGAASFLVVQRVLEATTDAPVSAEVLLIEADIAAAQITSDFALAGTLDAAPFVDRCLDIAERFEAVVDSAVWMPLESEILDDPTTLRDESRPELPARCHLEARPQ